MRVATVGVRVVLEDGSVLTYEGKPDPRESESVVLRIERDTLDVTQAGDTVRRHAYDPNGTTRLHARLSLAEVKASAAVHLRGGTRVDIECGATSRTHGTAHSTPTLAAVTCLDCLRSRVAALVGALDAATP